MQPDVQATTNLLSAITVLTGLATVLLLAFLAMRSAGMGSDISEKVLRFFGRKALPFSFIVALGAAAGSIYYSDIAGFAPCLLCWWQRIFLFPQIVLLAVALWKKDARARMYTLAFSAIGGIIALYHTYITFGGSEFVSCAGNGITASCAKVYFLEYGYVTIPTMALTAFAAMITLALLAPKEE